MVRPFLRWIVSAKHRPKAGARHKRKMTRGRIQAHSSNREGRTYVTKVLSGVRIWWIAAVCIAVSISPGARAADDPKPAETLYLQLGQVGLDPARVYQVRGASLN